MATKSKTLQRKKPGYTKSGVAKIVSLSYKQLTGLLANTSKKKVKAKISNRMSILERRKGFIAPVTETEVTE